MGSFREPQPGQALVVVLFPVLGPLGQLPCGMTGGYGFLQYDIQAFSRECVWDADRMTGKISFWILRAHRTGGRYSTAGICNIFEQEQVFRTFNFARCKSYSVQRHRAKLIYYHCRQYLKATVFSASLLTTADSCGHPFTRLLADNSHKMIVSK